MYASTALYAILGASLALNFGPSGDAKEPAQDVREARISLQLNAIVVSCLVERYEKYARRKKGSGVFSDTEKTPDPFFAGSLRLFRPTLLNLGTR